MVIPHRLLTQQNASYLKEIVRRLWATFLYGLVLLFAHKRKYKRSRIVTLFYGGARSRGIGGPVVKVYRLKKYFPQKIGFFDAVYSLSNTPYLNQKTLQLIKDRGIPILHNQNGVFYPGWYRGNWESQNERMSLGYHAADYVFWQSEFCKRASNKFLGDRKGDGEVLYNAVDTSVFSPKKRNSSSCFSYLITGKFDTHVLYRVRAAIAGLAMVRKEGLNAELKIGGWIERSDLVQDMIADFNLAGYVHLLGPYNQSTAPDIYRSADAFVMLKYLDPCPNTVIEALSTGLPIVYSSSGGVPELVGAEAGVGMPVPIDWFKLHTPNESQIAASMLEVFEKRVPMGDAARQRAIEMFDITKWVNRHNEVLISLLESRH